MAREGRPRSAASDRRLVDRAGAGLQHGWRGPRDHDDQAIEVQPCLDVLRQGSINAAIVAPGARAQADGHDIVRLIGEVAHRSPGEVGDAHLREIEQQAADARQVAGRAIVRLQAIAISLQWRKYGEGCGVVNERYRISPRTI